MFTLYFPRVEASSAARQETEAPPSYLRGTETLLVVEDEEQLRKMTARILRSYGYRVLEAANPGEALLHSERYAGPIHLMLTDILMPGITGSELAARIEPIRPAMKIAFMSGYGDLAVAERIPQDGSYLAKPFSAEALAGKVREVLGAPQTAGTALIVNDDPALDTGRRSVLTSLGYRVLEARSAEEAIRILEGSVVDLLLLDLATVKSESSATIQALRSLRGELRIVAMSDERPAALAATAEGLGVHALLVDPIRPDELREAVARVMRGRGKW